MPAAQRERDRPPLIAVLFVLIGVLVTLHLLSLAIGERSWQMERLFNLGLEANVPTWFSSLVLAWSSLTAASCAQWSTIESSRRVWRVLALGLLFMSCDEVAMLHENLEQVLRGHHVVSLPDSSVLPVAWPVLLGPFIAAGVWWLGAHLRTMLADQPGVGRRLGFGAVIYFAGAMGVEMLTDLMNHDRGWIAQFRLILEESLEMIGLVIVLSGLLLCQQRLQQSARPDAIRH